MNVRVCYGIVTKGRSAYIGGHTDDSWHNNALWSVIYPRSWSKQLINETTLRTHGIVNVCACILINKILQLQGHAFPLTKLFILRNYRTCKIALCNSNNEVVYYHCCSKAMKWGAVKVYRKNKLLNHNYLMYYRHFTHSKDNWNEVLVKFRQLSFGFYVIILYF